MSAKRYSIRPETHCFYETLYADWLWVAQIKCWFYQWTLGKYPEVKIKDTRTGRYAKES